jgi:hypothetical protein
VSDTCANYSTAIIEEIIVGQHVRHRFPVAGSEVPLKAIAHSACRVFQPTRLHVQFVEAGECGVEVCLVEDFDAADPVAVDRGDVDRPPLGVETRL